VTLEPTASATGRLLDASGQPLAGIEVRVERLVDEPTRGAQLEFGPSIHAVTANDGTFRIEGLVAGTAQNLRASGFDGGDNGDILHGWPPASGEIRDLGTIQAK
jgi:hypothetical protein